MATFQTSSKKALFFGQGLKLPFANLAKRIALYIWTRFANSQVSNLVQKPSIFGKLFIIYSLGAEGIYNVIYPQLLPATPEGIYNNYARNEMHVEILCLLVIAISATFLAPTTTYLTRLSRNSSYEQSLMWKTCRFAAAHSVLYYTIILYDYAYAVNGNKQVLAQQQWHLKRYIQ